MSWGFSPVGGVHSIQIQGSRVQTPRKHSYGCTGSLITVQKVLDSRPHTRRQATYAVAGAASNALPAWPWPRLLASQ